jgi:hypothetical protein
LPPNSEKLSASTVAGAATTFVAFLLISLEIKAPATALASTVTGAILLYWKNKVNKQLASNFSFFLCFLLGQSLSDASMKVIL